MQKYLTPLLEFISFLILMFVLGLGTIIYVIFVSLYWLYAKATGQEHLIQ